MSERRLDRELVDDLLELLSLTAELFPRVGFVVTDLKWSSRRIVRFYNQCGRAEQYIKEGKYALN